MEGGPASTLLRGTLKSPLRAPSAPDTDKNHSGHSQGDPGVPGEGGGEHHQKRELALPRWGAARVGMWAGVWGGSQPYCCWMEVA